MRTITKRFLVCIVAMSVAVGAVVQADATDEATREQLAALKKLCDDGLVGPDICRDKQRELLGLAPRTSGPPAASARPGKESKERGPSPAPPARAEVSAERVDESPLGFRMHLSARWLRASPQEMQKGFALLKTQVESNPEVKRAWERVSDNVEIYIRDGEHMGIQTRDGAVPRNAADAATVCQHLSNMIAKITSRPLAMHECGLRTIAGVTTFYVDHDGVVNGMRTMQFWLEKSPAKVLQFTLNCRGENVDARREELTDIVASVRSL